jgi:hypothetical protein
MSSTVDGIPIHFNPQQLKACASIRFKLQSLSNITSFKSKALIHTKKSKMRQSIQLILE